MLILDLPLTIARVAAIGGGLGFVLLAGGYLADLPAYLALRARSNGQAMRWDGVVPKDWAFVLRVAGAVMLVVGLAAACLAGFMHAAVNQ